MSHIKPFRQFEHDRSDPPEHVAYLVHLDPPYIPEGCEDDRSKWVCHYLGSTETWRLLKRIFTDHGTVNGARVLEVQKEAGGTWHLVRTWAGGRDKEVQLKQRSGTSYCPEPQCAGEHARPGSSRPTGRYRTRRQRAAAQRAREAREASPVRAARETTYEEMHKHFRSSKEISEEAFWELEPHIERLEAQWCRELRERETEMLGRQSRAAAREYAQQDAEADALFAEADRLDDLAGQPGGYRQQITAARAARIRAQLAADLVLGDPGQLAAVPELQDAERDAEIDRLAEIFPEPVPEAQGGMAAPDYYRSAPGSAEHRDAHRQMFAGAAGIGFAHPDPDLSYEIDNASELAAERYYEELAARHYRELGGPEADEAAQPGGACMSPGCDCAYGHPDRPAGRQAAAEPGWVDAARWIPGQERDEAEIAGELLSEHAVRAEDAWRRERTATAGEHLAELAHDEQALGRARQDAAMARAAREAATRSAYLAAAAMQRSALGPELGDAGGRSALPQVLETSPATLAPVAATLPDGTPHAGAGRVVRQIIHTAQNWPDMREREAGS